MAKISKNSEDRLDKVRTRSNQSRDENGKLLRLSCGRCEACNKTLSTVEMKLKGFITGQELGLCGFCSQSVNAYSFLCGEDNEQYTSGPVDIWDKERIDKEYNNNGKVPETC